LIDSDPQLADKPYEERARLCYLWDRDMVEQSDALVIDATFPAIGIGVELQVAAAKGIPVVLSFNQALGNRLQPVQYENPDHSKHDLQIGDGFISLMALGIPTIFRIVEYSIPNNGIADITEAISLLRRS